MTGTVESGPDSLYTAICLPAGKDIRCADIFTYGDGELKRLESHVRLESGSDSAIVKLEAGAKVVVGIANSQDRFNDEALDAFDSMELLRFYYRDEGENTRLMSASTVCDAGDTVVLDFSSPLCIIELTEVSHQFDAYKRLEDPIVYLSDVNPCVEALRRDSFLPVETDADTSGMRGLMWDRLPCDIGMYPQHPGTTLLCYPNESTVTPTRLTVEGRQSGGGLCRFTTTLPPLSYGRHIHVSLEISDKPESYKFSVN